jgi:hypothetical protein
MRRRAVPVFQKGNETRGLEPKPSFDHLFKERRQAIEFI